MPGSKRTKPSLKSKKVTATKKQESQCCVYDFTLFDDLNTKDIRSILSDHCKKYCFQLEEGEETNKRHYQGRMSLKVKKRKSEVIKLLGKQWNKFHVSVTSNENKNNNFYVLKEETRVEGPFTDENDIYIPSDISGITLRPWQQALKDILSQYSDRKIDIVYDKNGNIGKTTFVKHMCITEEAELLPMCNDYKDVMRMAYCVGISKLYLIDMPRAINKEKLYGFFSAIESLKGGFSWDDRHVYKRRFFDRPRICLFTNVIPDVKLLSKDMWQFWKVDNDELIQMEKWEYTEEVDPSLYKNIEYVSDLESDDEFTDMDVSFLPETKFPSDDRLSTSSSGSIYEDHRPPKNMLRISSKSKGSSKSSSSSHSDDIPDLFDFEVDFNTTEKKKKKK